MSKETKHNMGRHMRHKNHVRYRAPTQYRGREELRKRKRKRFPEQVLLARLSGEDASLVTRRAFWVGEQHKQIQRGVKQQGLFEELEADIAGLNVPEGDESVNVSQTQIIKGLIYYYLRACTIFSK